MAESFFASIHPCVCACTVYVKTGVPVIFADDVPDVCVALLVLDELEPDVEDELPEPDDVGFDLAVSFISIASILRPRPVVPAVSPFFTQLVQPTL